MDLISGMYAPTITELSIGPQGNGGLAVTRTLIGNGWRENFIGTINSSGSTYTVSIGGASEAFTLSGTTYTPQDGSASTLVQSNSNYVYTTGDGTIFTFYPTTSLPDLIASSGTISSMKRPDGEIVSYNYERYIVCPNGGNRNRYPAGGADAAAQTSSSNPSVNCIEREYYRVASISNNLGYMIKIGYENAGTLQSIYSVVSLTASNSKSTTGGTPLPSATMSGSASNPRTLTDALGRVTSFGYDSAGHLLTYTRPGYAAVSVTYDASGRVATWSDGMAAYKYAYSTNGATQTTTVTTPTGTRTATSNTSLLELLSSTDELNHTTRYQYDGSRRVTQVTQPEGNATAYAYDGRGNVTTTTRIPIPGSNVPNIVTTASYDASCTIPVKCNKPNATFDALNHETDYSYDPTHGGVTAVSPPAPAAGAVRGQTRYGYTQLAGGAGSVYRLTSTSACATCQGTSDEVKTYLGYDANLQLNAVTSGSGDGSLAASTSIVYDQVGNLYTVQGPLGLGQTTRYRYDADRELVGVVGPDPDGSGPLVPKAVRLTYNLQGQVSETEVGTVNSQSDADWSGFSSQLQTGYGYSGQGLKASAVSTGGGSVGSVTQWAYDGADRLQCAAVRMNAANFATEYGGACTQEAASFDGPDVITAYSYDAVNRLTAVVDGYGTALQRNPYGVTGYSLGGLPSYVADGKGDQTTNYYDGFDRLGAIAYPRPLRPARATPTTPTATPMTPTAT